MKSILLISLLALRFSTAHGQSWKEYGDSARAYLSQKNADKAIELYSRELEELKKDSAGTNTDAHLCDTLGVMLGQQVRYKEAETLLLEAKKIRENLYGKQSVDYANSCHNLGTTYMYMQQYEKAAQLYLEAKQIREKVLGRENALYAFSCSKLATVYWYMGQNEKAEPLYLEAIQIQEKLVGKHHPYYAASCENLAILYGNMGQNEKAEALFLEAKQIQEEAIGKRDPDYASTCHNLGNLYLKTQQYEKALPLLLEAKQIRENSPGKRHPDYVKSCISLSAVYQSLRQYDKAAPLLLEAIQIQEKLTGKENQDYTSNCISFGIVYESMGEYDKAEPFLLEAKEIREKMFGKQHPAYILSCNSLAVLYWYTGQYEKAQPLYLECMQAQEKLAGKHNPNYASFCENLGILYMYLGKYEKAEPLALQAIQIKEEVSGKQNTEYATACMNLANLYSKMGQYEKVERLELEANQIWEKLNGKQDPNYASTCQNLGNLYVATGKYEKAEPLLLEAMQIREKVLGKQHPDYAASCNSLAALYFNTAEYGKAEQLLLEAKQIEEKLLGKQHIEYAKSCENLASLYLQTGQFEKAEPLYLEAKQVVEKAVGNKHPEYGTLCDNLANLYWLLHQPLKAEAEFKKAHAIDSFNLFSVFQFTTEKEKTEFTKNVLGGDARAYSFYVAEKLSSEQPYSLSIFHRNLILSSSEALQTQLFYSKDTAVIAKYNAWLGQKKYLSVLYSKPVNARKEDVAQIEEKNEQLEKELARLSSSFRKQQLRVDWKDIQARLQADEAAIEFVSFPYNNGMHLTDSIDYVALVLRKNAPLPATVFLFTEKQLKSLLSATVDTLYTSRGVIGTSKIGANKSIYDLVWKPLEKELTGIKTIYFAPAGTLHRIAFAALPINKKEVLSDKYNLIQLASTASVPDLSPTFVTSSDNFRLYGGINYDVDSTDLRKSALLYAGNTTKAETRSVPDDLIRSGSFNFLPGTQAEIDSIESLAKKREINLVTLSRIDATEESFKALNGEASPTVIHIATHGFFFPDPANQPKNNLPNNLNGNGSLFRQSDNPLFRSGLLFAGSNLAWQGHPIEGIDDGILTAYEVSNMYLPNTKLVVLSACETALGDIQGSEGVYGLQRAFKIAGVPNLVMSLWKVPDAETVEFMQEFYKNLFAGKSISNAFYQAQNTLKAKYRTDPYKWAAWVLVR